MSLRVAGENIRSEINGLNVSYNDYGPVYAPVVIFLHGASFNKSIWDLQTEVLKNNYRVIAYDLRGHGGTPGNNEISIEALTADLIHMMDELKINTAILCGHSLGSFVALNAVENYPGRFNGLVLTGTQCMVDSPETIAERMAAIHTLKTGGIDKYADEIIPRFFGSRSFLTRKEEVRAARNMIMATPVESVTATLEAMNSRKEYCSGLSRIDIPVMIMTGREDKITPLSMAQNVHHNIAGSTLVVIEYAGHLAHLENTHEFNQYLKKFIDHTCKSQHLSKHCEEDAKTEIRSKKLKV